ncbi:hypothetical protein D7V64_00305 [Acinetobacter cumulans]|uniref:Uncharacterized protein n=1 Tax=Acinetobacter cumulans TaxID=2136182 RepID=A0A3A8GP33_9GAMM|nr:MULTISPECIES: hypothetical protein [Acinetobacter]NWK74949.1 hypothetical protein [Acinetobacter sp. SwsAc6]RKG55591.1 hypothetical protein D7V64_00305 [Acinetobacter cumulans]RLL36348.1 hypothetical protein D9K80_05855 [Acinetobacter cumulans]
MKKIHIAILIVTGIFLVCLAISILIKKFFSVDGDYLSASATLVAALVAAYLYSDWRHQYKVELFERTKNKIHDLFINAEGVFNRLHLLFVNSEPNKIDIKELVQLQIEYQGAIDILTSELDFYEQLLSKYQPNDFTINCLPTNAKKMLMTNTRKLHPKLEKNKDYECFTEIQKQLSNNDIYEENLKLKVFTNSDLQRLIIKLLDK